MSSNCDVCGEEVRYSEPIFKLRNEGKIIICINCINKEIRKLL